MVSQPDPQEQPGLFLKHNVHIPVTSRKPSIAILFQAPVVPVRFHIKEPMKMVYRAEYIWIDGQ